MEDKVLAKLFLFLGNVPDGKLKEPVLYIMIKGH